MSQPRLKKLPLARFRCDKDASMRGGYEPLANLPWIRSGWVSEQVPGETDRGRVMSDRAYRIETVESAPFSENSYVFWRSGRTEALVIDPGFDVGAIRAILDANHLAPAAILNTHGHVDHIAGNAEMKEGYPEAPLIIGRNEAQLLSDPVANLSSSWMALVSPPADRLVDHGERIDLAGVSIEVREIPGHSPGSVVFILDEFDPPIVFGGDVLFAGSVGRTDLVGGSGPQLFAGIRAHLYNLPDSTILWPGHGPATTIGEEKRTNPFVRERPLR